MPTLSPGTQNIEDIWNNLSERMMDRLTLQCPSHLVKLRHGLERGRLLPLFFEAGLWVGY